MQISQGFTTKSIKKIEKNQQIVIKNFVLKDLLNDSDLDINAEDAIMKVTILWSR